MLTHGEINHFDTFGFLVHRQAFDPAEMAVIGAEFEVVCTQLLGHAPGAGDIVWEQPFVELSRGLSRIVEDDRVYEPTQDLLGEGMLWGGSEGMWGVDSLADHHWHPDGGWVPEQMTAHRLKVMIYMDEQRRDTGALRIVPGSHRSALHEALLSFTDVADDDDPRYCGMRGPDVPCHAIETDPGDIVFFNNWLFHAVYGKVHPRRCIVLKFMEAPSLESHFAEIREQEGIYTVHESFIDSDSRRIRGLVSRLREAHEVG